MLKGKPIILVQVKPICILIMDTVCRYVGQERIVRAGNLWKVRLPALSVQVCNEARGLGYGKESDAKKKRKTK